MFVVENWQWPQWAVAIIILVSLGYSAAKSGQEESTSFVSALIAAGIEVLLLICGGFYRTMDWPQIALTVLLIISVGYSYHVRDEYQEHSFAATLIANAIVVFLLIMGRFFA